MIFHYNEPSNDSVILLYRLVLHFLLMISSIRILMIIFGGGSSCKYRRIVGLNGLVIVTFYPCIYRFFWHNVEFWTRDLNLLFIPWLSWVALIDHYSPRPLMHSYTYCYTYQLVPNILRNTNQLRYVLQLQKDACF